MPTMTAPKTYHWAWGIGSALEEIKTNGFRVRTRLARFTREQADKAEVVHSLRVIRKGDLVIVDKAIDFHGRVKSTNVVLEVI